MRGATTFLTVTAAALVLSSPAFAGKKNKKNKKENAAPTVGWHKKEAWSGSCFFPPDFDKLASGPKRMKWQETRNAFMSQINGSREDGLAIDDITATNVETALLAKPERIEVVAQTQLQHCKDAMSGKGTAAWESWIRGLYAQLTAGECPNPPLDYTLYDYLNIGVEWQIPTRVCKDDHFWVKASEMDYYRISDDGPWINAAGDPSLPASGSLPCNIEGCFKGQLIMRFTGESGINQIVPVGLALDFVAPEHGEIHVMINDDTWFDNIFKVESGLEHHTSIEYSPFAK